MSVASADLLVGVDMKPICRISHPQILAGLCPWCNSIIGDSGSTPGSTPTIWNIPAIAAALEDQDYEVRSMTVRNLYRKSVSIESAIPLLFKTLSDKSERIRSDAEQGLSFLGTELTPDE